MKFQVVMVDPEKARSWLQKNTKNRKVRQWHVDRLAKEMLSGKWVLNGQTISFSSEGVLLDGQHRLYAVIQANMAVPMSVAYGVTDPNAFKTYDITMLKRGVEQVVSFMGIDNANNVTAIARRLLHWDKTIDKTTFSLTKENNAQNLMFSNDEVLDYVLINQDEIQSMLKDMSKSLPARRCGARSAFTAALIICNRQDDVTTLLFNEGLMTGVGLVEHSPILLLRERLVDPPDRRGKGWETEVMALTIKAWNKFHYKKPLRTLRWRQDGDAPEHFPVPGEKQ